MTATARRGHGEGSVYRDAANGTWVGAISLGWRPDGSRVRRKVTGRTKTEVREKLKKLQVEADAGLKTSASYTVARAVDDWAAEALHTGIALVTGTEDRQWLYPAMTRGTDTNLTYVFTTPAHPADPPLSDSAIRQQNLANADHLAVLHAIWTVLHAIWTAETRGARHDHYRNLVTAALPPGHRQPLSHQARWLYRTLHAAELRPEPRRSDPHRHHLPRPGRRSRHRRRPGRPDPPLHRPADPSATRPMDQDPAADDGFGFRRLSLFHEVQYRHEVAVRARSPHRPWSAAISPAWSAWGGRRRSSMCRHPHASDTQMDGSF